VKTFRESLLPRLSVERPITVIMVLTALLVVGLIAYTRISVSMWPEGFEGKWLGFWTSYENATPTDVERTITVRIEEGLATLRRVERIRTFSFADGVWTSIRFLPGTDMTQAYGELWERLHRVAPELPEISRRFRVRRWDPDDHPLVWTSVAFPQGIERSFELLDRFLKPYLLRVDGVAQVEIWGAGHREVHVQMDLERMRRHGVEAPELVRSMQDLNLAIPSGFVRDGGRKLYMRSLEVLKSLAEMRTTTVDWEHNLQLEDLATVELVQKNWRSARLDRKEALYVVIWREAGANMVQVSQAILAALDKVGGRPELRGANIKVLDDGGARVTEAIDNLKSSGLWGGLFAAIVLFLFLRTISMTLVITMAIPLSILSVIVVLFFLDWSLNLATMMGLMLSLGLVVDNAIVIVENIYRKRQQGVGPRAASVEGASEVAMAVSMATLTTIVVFLPLILMSDDEHLAFWMLRLGMPVIVGLAASLVIALVIIPLAVMRLQGRERTEVKLLASLRRRYVPSLNWVLRHRLDTFIVVALALALASIWIPMEGLKKMDKVQGYQRDISLHFSMPSGQSREQALQWFEAVEDTIMNHEKAYNLWTIRGWYSNSLARVIVVFNPPKRIEWYQVAFNDLAIWSGLREKLHLTPTECGEDLKKRLRLPAGYIMKVDWEENEARPSVKVDLHGEDTRILAGLAMEVKRRLEDIPGLLEVFTEIDVGSPELQVNLNEDQFRKYGLDPREALRDITYAFRGTDVAGFRSEEGVDMDLRVLLAEDDRQNIQSLREFAFRTGEGKEIPLEALASISQTRGMSRIVRENRQTTVQVTAVARKEDAKKLFEQVDVAMEGFEMPRGYSWDKGARYERMEEADESQRFAIILATTCVFLLMGMLFESLLLPLSVIVAVPFAFLGVYWTLYLTGSPMDMLSQIGMVLLIGVVVNNAIVMVDLTNRLRAEGMGRHEALIEAGRHRFRPILMTTFTTVCGLIPMAVGNAKVFGWQYAPLGRTIIGGMLVSMVLTLIIVPLFYTLFDDLRLLIRRVVVLGAYRRRLSSS
jgi:HAE1 family hydrophobic/amphiphilic exporter-1